MDKLFYSFNDYLTGRFGARVHRLSLNAGFSCPNKDGTLSGEGCIFCNEKGFSRFAETGLSLKKQLLSSMDDAKKHFKAQKFIAYFQNASNTYADTRTLKKTYDIIRSFPDIVGLFISTRPDCIDERKLDLIESYSDSYEVWVEYGLQTIHDATLGVINRSHTFLQTQKAIEDTAERKIKVGVHLILGLPGESRDDMMKTAQKVASLPVSGVKFHCLHVLRDTKLETMFRKGGIKLLQSHEYVSLVCDFLERLNPDCVVLRLVSDAKKDFLIAPDWINDKQKIIEAVKNELRQRNRSQGTKYEAKKDMCLR